MSHEFCTTTKQSTIKPCRYLVEYTVHLPSYLPWVPCILDASVVTYRGCDVVFAGVWLDVSRVTEHRTCVPGNNIHLATPTAAGLQWRASLISGNRWSHMETTKTDQIPKWEFYSVWVFGTFHHHARQMVCGYTWIVGPGKIIALPVPYVSVYRW